ncbi:MAG: TonB-dependent receptor, partial [Candidatus Omnitrophica bacterium]|nr:TonB-dependent receptor [Candidatus Omnitrophota bacterium]
MKVEGRRWKVEVAAVLLMAPTAWADELSSKSRLEEVVVSATRSDVPRHKLTKSVSVVTAEDIRNQRADTALEVLRNVPGVFVRRSGSFGRTTSVVIRGSADDQVLVLIDGVEVASPTLGSFNFAQLPADFIERIEVLRGSSSTLYGSKAIG